MNTAFPQHPFTLARSSPLNPRTRAIQPCASIPATHPCSTTPAHPCTALDHHVLISIHTQDAQRDVPAAAQGDGALRGQHPQQMRTY